MGNRGSLSQRVKPGVRRVGSKEQGFALVGCCPEVGAILCPGISIMLLSAMRGAGGGWGLPWVRQQGRPP